MNPFINFNVYTFTVYTTGKTNNKYNKTKTKTQRINKYVT